MNLHVTFDWPLTPDNQGNNGRGGDGQLRVLSGQEEGLAATTQGDEW